MVVRVESKVAGINESYFMFNARLQKQYVVGGGLFAGRT